jgi:hypothetical protein
VVLDDKAVDGHSFECHDDFWPGPCVEYAMRSVRNPSLETAKAAATFLRLGWWSVSDK